MKFYNRTDVVQIAKELLGKVLVHRLNDQLLASRIVETEAYVGLTDRASHSFGGRRTQKNEHMYAAPGTAYIYICYGTHHLFNVVTNRIDVPDAVLIRAGEPIVETDQMLLNAGKATLDRTLTKGPGNLSRAMGIHKGLSGNSLLGSQLYIAKVKELEPAPHEIGISGRIGIEGAGPEAVQLPYRFYIKGNRYVSGSPIR